MAQGARRRGVGVPRTRQLPNDDVHFELLLANLELDQLEANQRGKDVRLPMALPGLVACREGEEQDGALRRLCGMAKAGRLR